MEENNNQIEWVAPEFEQHQKVNLGLLQ